MDYKEFIASDANIMLGKPIVKGTRIPVALVLQKLSEGAMIQDLLSAYPGLTYMSISAVLAYAFDAVANGNIISST
ncbi:DUF433 domain-containing protein [Chitinophaga eiseniae]|uniref:DUF433 domain-containing protein n=1 Tax=Chitinophaga eiseniae TaxID=634771 RepID=A0A847SLA4_9BACT|nr:DUF433 domain-containing protein [Chitinophaga eiseniae]NLR79577.1 DUF433 domain-containing protein [Chitinophaga eiseniae]